jgi:hypothetical protein
MEREIVAWTAWLAARKVGPIAIFASASPIHSTSLSFIAGTLSNDASVAQNTLLSAAVFQH